MDEIPWIPAWVAHPISLCAVFQCPNPRHFDMVANSVRRWCTFHVRHRELILARGDLSPVLRLHEVPIESEQLRPGSTP